jgi:hypothetical protein
MNWIDSFFHWLATWFSSAPEGSTVAKVQAATVKACGFLPTAETVVALIPLQHPAKDMAVLLARKICTAVTKSYTASRTMGEPKLLPEVDGVIIEGEYINKGVK